MGSGTYHENYLDSIAQGTAHLLEHSLFLNLNSKERNMLSAWNAWTGEEATQYMFSTSNKNFLKSFEIYWRL